jgi:hypothetical protein
MIGGEIVIQDYLPQQKWRRSEDRMFPVTSTNPIGLATAILLVVKSQLATDPFFFTEGFSAGVLESLLLGIVLLCCTQFSMFLFSRSWQYGRAYSYSEVWATTFGPRLAWLPTVILILLYVCFNMDACWEVNENTIFLITEYWPDYPEIFDNPWLLEMICTLVFVLPAGLVGRFVDLLPLAVLGIFGVVLGVICLALTLVREIDTYGFDPEHQMVLFGQDLGAAMNCAQAYIVVFFFHPFLTLIFRDLQDASISRCLKTCWLSNTVTFVLMYLGGLMSYLLFREGEDLENNVFEWLNLRQPEVALGLAASDLAAACTLAYFCAYISRLIITLVLGRDTTNRICTFIGVLATVFTFMYFIFVEYKIYFLVYMLGEFAAIFLGFILPPAYYLAQFRGLNKLLAAGAVTMIVIGLGFAAFLLYTTLPVLKAVWLAA